MAGFCLYAPLHSELEPRLLTIELASSLQLPSFHIVGLPDPEVSEARERVRAAITSCGFEFPRRRVVLNLSPASLRKRGTGLDLAMALAVLASDLPEAPPSRWAAWGELGLDGTIKPVGQVTRLLTAAWREGVQHLLLSPVDYEISRARYALVGDAGPADKPGPALHPVRTLAEAYGLFMDPPASPTPPFYPEPSPPEVSSDHLMPIPASLGRILGVAAAGGHHVLLVGPRGVGKSHALDWLCALHRPPDADIRLSQLLLQELVSPYPLPGSLPIRRVGVQVRPSALIGSTASQNIRPGEFSLAHGGILVADEFPEWPRDSREALREPLERGSVILNRARGTVELPSRFVLAATGNFCPCGGWPREVAPPPGADEAERAKLTLCDCPFTIRKRYLARLSGPVLDRIDLLLRLNSPLSRQNDPAGASQVLDLRRVVRETEARLTRQWGGRPGQMPPGRINRILRDHPEWEEQGELGQTPSLRSRHKLIRVALSLAAWDGAPFPQKEHFYEAHCYRPERFSQGGSHGG